jgi:hypothetical protein
VTRHAALYRMCAKPSPTPGRGTGATQFGVEVTPKQLELAHELVPTATGDMASRHVVILLAAAAQGCNITEPSPSPGAERTSVARALNYYEGSEKRYLISTPQQGLTGRLNVCIGEEIVDSSGNKIEAGPMTIYEIEGTRDDDDRAYGGTSPWRGARW